MDKLTAQDRNEHIVGHNLKYSEKGFDTRAIHMGQPPDAIYGSVNMPIHMSTTYAQTDCATPFYNYDYGRGGNPTREALETVIASLENAKYGLVAGSGLGIVMLITHMLKSGDHILCVDDVYGGTGRYFTKIATPVYNMKTTLIDMTDLDSITDAITEDTKLLWLETPTNPLLKCFDIRAISEICKKHDIIFVVDNTFMTSVNQRPLDHGADIVMQSVTKYMGGHSDVVMGALATNNKDLFDR
jgi:cystathionine gamma-lyase